MGSFICENCNCVENTACAPGPRGARKPELYDWSGIESLKGLCLCSACAPTHFNNGVPTKWGKWHNRFTRYYLDPKLFIRNSVGLLEHKETGETDLRPYYIPNPNL